MKTQLSKPARGYARYTDEYKEQALQLWRASGRSAAKVAAELGIRPPLIYRGGRPDGTFCAFCDVNKRRCGGLSARRPSYDNLFLRLIVTRFLTRGQ